MPSAFTTHTPSFTRYAICRPVGREGHRPYGFPTLIREMDRRTAVDIHDVQLPNTTRDPSGEIAPYGLTIGSAFSRVWDPSAWRM